MDYLEQKRLCLLCHPEPTEAELDYEIIVCYKHTVFAGDKDGVAFQKLSEKVKQEVR